MTNLWHELSAVCDTGQITARSVVKNCSVNNYTVCNTTYLLYNSSSTEMMHHLFKAVFCFLSSIWANSSSSITQNKFWSWSNCTVRLLPFYGTFLCTFLHIYFFYIFLQYKGHVFTKWRLVSNYSIGLYSQHFGDSSTLGVNNLLYPERSGYWGPSVLIGYQFILGQ